MGRCACAPGPAASRRRRRCSTSAASCATNSARSSAVVTTRTCGTHRAHAQVSSAGRTTTDTSSGEWCTASWISHQRAIAERAAGGPARPSGRTRRSTTTGTERSRPPGRSRPPSRTRVLDGGEPQPTRSTSQSLSGGRRAHSSVPGVSATRASTAGSGKAARRRSVSAVSWAARRAIAASRSARNVPPARRRKRRPCQRSPSPVDSSISGDSSPNSRNTVEPVAQASPPAASAGTTAAIHCTGCGRSRAGGSGSSTTSAVDPVSATRGGRCTSSAPSSTVTAAAPTVGAATVSSESPSCSTAPGASGAPVRGTGSPSMVAPFVEPCSSTTTRPAPISRVTCRREMRASSRVMSQSAPRPTVTRPRCRACTRPAAGPPATRSTDG